MWLTSSWCPGEKRPTRGEMLGSPAHDSRWMKDEYLRRVQWVSVCCRDNNISVWPGLWSLYINLCVSRIQRELPLLFPFLAATGDRTKKSCSCVSSVRCIVIILRFHSFFFPKIKRLLPLPPLSSLSKSIDSENMCRTKNALMILSLFLFLSFIVSWAKEQGKMGAKDESVRGVNPLRTSWMWPEIGWFLFTFFLPWWLLPCSCFAGSTPVYQGGRERKGALLGWSCTCTRAMLSSQSSISSD